MRCTQAVADSITATQVAPDADRTLVQAQLDALAYVLASGSRRIAAALAQRLLPVPPPPPPPPPPLLLLLLSPARMKVRCRG